VGVSIVAAGRYRSVELGEAVSTRGKSDGVKLEEFCGVQEVKRKESSNENFMIDVNAE
jgi:hypothetical protein